MPTPLPNLAQDTHQLTFAPVPLAQRLFVPVNQPAGLMRTREPGERVTAGEPLATIGPDAQPIAPSPMAGRVGVVSHATLLNGRSVEAVQIEKIDPAADAASDTIDPAAAPPPRVAALPAWIDRLLAGGVNAMRANSPDLIAQLQRCRNVGVDTVVCCLLDADVNLPVNATVARSAPAELAAGIDLLTKLTGAPRAWVVVDAALPARALPALNPLVRSDGLRLVELPNDYPQADPTVLLHTLLGRRLKPAMLPVERGVLLLDAQAAVAVGQLVLHHRPMLQVPLALRDHVAGLTYLLWAAVGTRLGDLCAWVGVPAQATTLRGGDLLRDVLLAPTAVLGPGELTVHVTARETPVNPSPCIRCGWCIDACPTRVHPARLLEAAQRSNLPLAEKFGLSACIECGICSYVCPSRLPLLSAIRTLKS